MSAFIIRRLLQGIPIVLSTTLLLFLLFNVLPGQDPAMIMAGKHATPEQLQTIRKEYGLDKSLPLQYLDMLRQTVTFDFGRSFATKEKISDILVRGAPVSFSLAAVPFFFTLITSVLLGFVLALNRGKWLDRSIVAICVGAQSVSILVYILGMQYCLAYLPRVFYPKSEFLRHFFPAQIFPISGYESGIFERWYYLTLPGIILLAISVAPEIRYYRTVILDEIYQDYVRTAKAKGLGTRAIMLRHVLKNAMIPIITNTVLAIPFLLLGTLLLESFFGIPGIGDITVRAIANNDRPLLISTTVFATVAFVIFNIISDILYAMVDPRVQLK